MTHNNTLSVAISRDEDAQHDLVLSFGTKGTTISGLSEADLLEIRSAIDCAIIKGEDDAHARLVDAAPELLKALVENIWHGDYEAPHEAYLDGSKLLYRIVGVDWDDYESRDEGYEKVLDMIAKTTGGTRHA